MERNRGLQSNIKEIYPNSSQISSLTLFNESNYVERDENVAIVDLTTDVDVDVVNVGSPLKAEIVEKHEQLATLTVDDEDQKLRFIFIEKKCSELGIELRNEDVGNGYSYRYVQLFF